ncbi:MAG: carboxypeptidase-like regulatory domain-containing protein, partial [Tannerella sp.]|nr:carboxypeptidase-like regulatory domain-containing protein [Tannerella sp.]
MKFYITFITVFLILPVFSSYGQIAIKGKVIYRENDVIVGATIREKGTDNAVLSDIEGNFNLQVTDSNSIIEISCIGFKTKEITIGMKRDFPVKLKGDCHIDFFDGDQIRLGLSSDPVNKQFGGFAQISRYSILGTLIGKIDYVSDFSDNFQWDATLGLLHFLVDCDYHTDAFLNYGNIKIANKFQFQNYNVEGKITFSYPEILPDYTNLHFGLGLSDMKKIDFSRTRQAGYMLGIGTALPFRMPFSEINVKTVYWTRFWEWKVEVFSEIKRF